MVKKTPPWPNYPKWTTARYYTFIRSALRSLSRKWPPLYEAKNAARRKYVGPKKQQKWEYQCALCQHWFMDKEVAVDHIVPAGQLNSYDDLPKFVERLLVPVEGFRVLCHPCHHKITQQQRADGYA